MGQTHPVHSRLCWCPQVSISLCWERQPGRAGGARCPNPTFGVSPGPSCWDVVAAAPSPGLRGRSDTWALSQALSVSCFCPGVLQRVLQRDLDPPALLPWLAACPVPSPPLQYSWGGGLRAGCAPSLAVPWPSWCHMLARGPCPAVPSAGTEAGAGASGLCISWYDWNYIYAPFPAPSLCPDVGSWHLSPVWGQPCPSAPETEPPGSSVPSSPSPGSHPASATLRGAWGSSCSRAVPQAPGLHSG